MISDPEGYFRDLVSPRGDLLLELEARAKDQRIPIVGPLVGQLLKSLIVANGAKRVLELGTAIGYSTIFLARGCQVTGGNLTSIDHDPDMSQRASYNLERAGLRHLVDLHVGDAFEEVALSRSVFDFIFLDTDKESYIEALQHCHRVLRRHGMLFVDNVAFEDARSFNEAITSNPAWETVHLYSFLPGHSPEHDGICLAVKME